MDIELDKAISLDLANCTIDGNVSITDSEFSETLNIKAGIITGNLTVNTPNATVNNEATVNGDITINGVAGGTWNENANGNTLVVNYENAKVNINGSTESVTITKAAAANISGEVTTFVANGAVEVTGAAKIKNAEITAGGVNLDAKPKSITTTVDVTIGGVEKTPGEVTAEESFLTSLAQVKSLNEDLYEINYSKVENKVEVEFKKAGLEKSGDNIVTDVESAARSFINAMFTNEELKVKEVVVLELTFTNVESDPILDLAGALLGGNLQGFLGGNEVDEVLDIKVILEDGTEFTVEDVNAIFRMDEALI